MASIKSISLPDGTSYDFKDEVSGYIKDTGVYGIYYGTCATAAGTAAKVATLDNSDGFSLTKGVTVAIEFTNSNTIANPTLNVDGSGAKSIKRYGTAAPSTSATSSWNAGSVLILVYDGRYWQLANWLNTTYSAMSVSEYEAGTGTSARLITPANLKAAIQYWETGEANVQADWVESDSTSDAYIKNKPTNVSAFVNDVGYLRSYTETDPTVPAWAKASSKPTYTASEVGAQPTLESGTNIKTINGNSILGSGNLVISGGGSEPTMQTLSVTSGGSGTWHYRIWPSGWQEAWYQGSITFSNASSTANGWNRSTQNFALPISFADDASILVSGSYSGKIYTQGGIKTNGTQFEAQILGGTALASGTRTAWSVYVAGYGRS